VVFHDVKARERELAIRMTLGADARHVVQSVLLRTGTTIVAGLCVGLVAAAWMGLRLEPLLFRTGGIDPRVDAAIVVVTVAIALVGSAGPLLRATRLQPAAVLRGE
jgi:ABC-type antimicrobial peptide transport system permease subunit